MRFTTTCLSLLLLSLIACQPLDETGTSTPDVSPSSAPTTASVSSLSAETQTTPTPDQSSSVAPKQAGWDPAENAGEKCLVMLAYDPEDSSVNLRDQPNGNVLTSLPNLTPLNAEGPAFIESGWNYVYVVNQDRWGYVWQDLIRRTYYQVDDPQDTYANLRQSPNGPVIEPLTNGTEVRFIGEAGTWTQVELANGQIGYVATALLSDPNCF